MSQGLHHPATVTNQNSSKKQPGGLLSSSGQTAIGGQYQFEPQIGQSIEISHGHQDVLSNSLPGGGGQSQSNRAAIGGAGYMSTRSSAVGAAGQLSSQANNNRQRFSDLGLAMM